MERARVFRTTGPIRILLGLTLPELLGIAFVSAVVLKFVEAPFYIELFTFVLSLVVSYVLLRLTKIVLKPGAVRDFLTWLRENDSYTPLADPDNTPLIWQPKEGV
ncbi:MAG: hypothetical protein ACRCYY_05135 [Trueperaceae bacterium]